MQQQRLLKNGGSLLVREAQPADAEALLAFIEQVAGESENLTFGPGEFDMTVEQECAILQTYSDAPTSLYLLAEQNGVLVGYLNFSAGKRARMSHTGELGISVARASWGLGVGGSLLAYLIDWARAGGIIRKIDLLVRVDNLPAIHLYRKYGFVKEGTQTRELYVHGQFVDVDMMGLQIDPA